MLSDKLQDALNEQIKHEYASAYYYLDMSAYCADRNLNGFAHWLRLQEEEEREHAMRLFNFMLDRGVRPRLRDIEAPPNDYAGLLDLMKRALEHEKQVTRMINELYALAVEERDYATQVQLQWFISEQVEEEALFTEVVERLEMAGDDSAALLMVDREMGSRSDADAGSDDA